MALKCTDLFSEFLFNSSFENDIILGVFAMCSNHILHITNMAYCLVEFPFSRVVALCVQLGLGRNMF